MADFKPHGKPQTGAAAFIEESNKRTSPYPTKKKKWEDNYKRATFYIQNDVMEELEYAAGNEKGEKTRIINEALQDWLEKNK